MTPNIVKIGIVDDHKLLRRMVSSYISAQPNFKVVLEASTGRQFISQFEHLQPKDRPALILTDVTMPEIDGFEIVHWARQNVRGAKLVVLTLATDEADVKRMIRLGISAYLHKTVEPEELIVALESVRINGYYYNDYMPKGAVIEPETPVEAAWYRLTIKERQIARAICSEQPYAEVAKNLSLSTHAFDLHRKAIFEKFEVTTKLGLILALAKNKLIDPK